MSTPTPSLADLDNQISIFFRNISSLLNNYIEFNKSQESQLAAMSDGAVKIADALAIRSAQNQVIFPSEFAHMLPDTNADQTDTQADLIVNKPQTCDQTLKEHAVQKTLTSDLIADKRQSDESLVTEMTIQESFNRANLSEMCEEGVADSPSNEMPHQKESDSDSESDSCDFNKLEIELENMTKRIHVMRASKLSTDLEESRTQLPTQTDFSTQTCFDSDENELLLLNKQDSTYDDSSVREAAQTTSKKTARNLSKTLTNLDTSSDCDSNLDDEQETANGGIYTNAISGLYANVQSQIHFSPSLPYCSNSQVEDECESDGYSSDRNDKENNVLHRRKVKKSDKCEKDVSEKKEEKGSGEVYVRKMNADLGISEYDLSPDTSDEEEKIINGKKNKVTGEKMDFLLSDDTLDGDSKKSSKLDKSKKLVILKSSDSSIDLSDSESRKTEEVIGKTYSIKREKLSASSESGSSPSGSVSRRLKRRRRRSPKVTNKREDIKEVPVGNEKELDETDIMEIENDSPIDTRSKLKKLIRDENLEIDTQAALIEENERLKRLRQKRQAFEKEGQVGKEDLKLSHFQKQQQREQVEFYLDIDLKTRQRQVRVDDSLTRMLKPHQIEGVQFMWDSCFESVEMIKDKSKGGGCLLAHCMGLGKTLQLITLAHTLLANEGLTRVKRILVLVPVNVEINWKKEFRKWTRDCEYKIVVSRLSKIKQGDDLKHQNIDDLKQWFNHGGVFLVGYNKFCRLINHGQGSNVFHKYLLDPGPDLIVFDEGHVLKNRETNLAQSLSDLRTLRRIVTTGTPLQNNLIEYHCMLNFVKPKLLGTLEEFKNRFVNPINNGQHKDSTDSDVRFMKKRAHVLHDLLEGCVQRKDSELMRELIPKKHEYVIKIRLSEKQVELYRMYLSGNEGCLDGPVKRSLVGDFQVFIKLTSHPWILRHKADFKKLTSGGSGQAKTCGNRDVDMIEDMEDMEFGESEVVTSENSKISWEKWVTPECEMSHEISGKFMVFLRILEETIKNGEKLVLFSQSRSTLNHIEHLLCKSKIPFLDKPWKRNTDFFRIDGQVSAETRSFSIDAFNDLNNTNAKLFLITTLAGGVGINLCAANRCIIYDCGWNPTHENQAVSRIYRLGQTRECFIYRFISQGCMEEKIYQRTVTKQALARRVIDEHQIDRHFSSEEKQKLYEFNPDVWDESLSGRQSLLKLPKDTVLADILKSMRRYIVDYHEYDSLFENRIDEELNEADRRSAWDEYEAEKEAKNARVTNTIGPSTSASGCISGGGTI